MCGRVGINTYFCPNFFALYRFGCSSSSSAAPKWMVTGLQGGGILRSQYHRVLAGPSLTQVGQTLCQSTLCILAVLAMCIM